MNYINITAKTSLFIQVLTALIDLFVLKYDLKKEDNILRQLLILELIVQFIEGGFYVWLVTGFDKISNITHYRYYDWVITTPTMLLTLMIYVLYIRYVEETDKPKKLDFFEVIEEYKNIFLIILFFNLMMLIAGYLGEIGKLSQKQSVIIGFVFFIIYYALIYEYFAKYTKKGKTIFNYFLGIWGLYGIAASTNYNIKNTSYNILDLFAKNFFGLYLSYLIYQKKLI